MQSALGNEKYIVITAPEGATAIALMNRAKKKGFRVILAMAEPWKHYQILAKDMAMEVPSNLYDVRILSETPQKLIEELRQYPISGVIPGSEIAVSYSDIIADAFHLSCNNPSTIPLRRNKWAMKQAMIRSGLRCAKGGLFSELQDALLFAENNLSYPFIVKPPAGASGHHVFFCHNKAQFIERFNKIRNTPDTYQENNEAVLVEECLTGDEYAVNLFASPETIAVTSIWKYEKEISSCNTPIYVNVILQDLNDPFFDELKKYAIAFARAVGVTLGPAHAEIRLTAQGPMGHEIGARMIGGAFEVYSTDCINFNTVDKCLEAFTSGTATIPQCIEQNQFLACVIPHNRVSGIIESIQGMQEIRHLNSFLREELFLKPGDQINETTDWDCIKFFIWLQNKNYSILQEDIKQAHNLFSLKVKTFR